MNGIKTFVLTLQSSAQSTQDTVIYSWKILDLFLPQRENRSSLSLNVLLQDIIIQLSHIWQDSWTAMSLAKYTNKVTPEVEEEWTNAVQPDFLNKGIFKLTWL